jgi:phage terminase large subunit
MTDAIEVHSEKPFKILYDLPEDTNLIICIGGRGGMKTYEVSKFCAYNATIKKKRCVILRDEKALIKETILNEILTRYDTANIYGALDTECVKLKTGIADKKSGKELVYTKGFRASANEKKANMKGVSDIDIAVIEEAEDLRNAEEFDTFVDGLRKEGCLVIIMLNTPDLGHFLIKRHFIAQQITFEHVPELIGKVDEKELIGYSELIPKEIEGFVCIQTGYEDNPYLPKHIIRRYKGYGDPSSHLYNLHHYLTAIKGYASTGRKGQVITKAKPIKLADYFKLPYKEHYGQDFGTSSPAGLIGVKKHRNTVWVRRA